MVTGPKSGSVGFPKCPPILANTTNKVKVNSYSKVCYDCNVFTRFLSIMDYIILISTFVILVANGNTSCHC